MMPAVGFGHLTTFHFDKVTLGKLMINFEFKRTNRKCSITGRSFASGEEYYSVLLDEDDELVRKDIAKDQWDQPPSNCVGWWMSRIPDLEQGKVYWAPRDVLFSYFQHLLQQPSQKDITYVMAILLLQKKLLRLLDNVQDQGVECMHVVCNSTKERFHVPVVTVSKERIATIQNDLAEKLFTDVAPTEDQ